MIPTAPANNLFVLIDKMYVDEIKAGNGIKLFKESSYAPEWNATINGHVVSVPLKLTHDLANYERKGLVRDDIIPGDDVIFKYLVVEDKEHYDAADKFWPNGEWEDSDREHEWKNHDGLTLRKFAIEKNHYAAVLQDKAGDPIDGCTGNRKEIEKWLSQFRFLEDGEVFYKNIVLHEGVVYWKVDYSLVIGVIREEKVKDKTVKRIIPGRGYVFIEPVEIDLGDMTEGGIIVPEYMRKQKSRRMGIARHIGQPRVGQPNLGLNPDDFVVYDEKYAEQYEVLGVPWLVLKHEYVQGKLI
jgi:hypothetical protein